MTDEKPGAEPGQEAAVRLDKRVAELMGCSRGEAQHYIEGGWVRVDGQVVEAPQHKVSGETIVVDAEAKPEPYVPATILLHKPAGLGSPEVLAAIRPDTRSVLDESGIRLVQRHFKQLQPVFELEREASGLVVYSQDARVLRWAEDKAAQVEQEFVVEVSGELAENGLARLAKGLSVDGRRLPPAKVSWQNETRLRFALKGAQPGQIRAMCAAVGLSVLGIRRLRLGRVGLAKMPAGEWRYLPPELRF